MNETGSDYETFVRHLVEHEPKMRAFLRTLLPTWDAVEEVAQDASLVAWRKYADFHEGSNFAGWLLTIARFEALKHRRKAARSPLVFDEDVWDMLADEAQGTSAADARREALEYCLNELHADQRSLLLQAHTPGVRLNEVARSTGRSEQALYKTVQRLRAALLQCIENRTRKEGLA